MSKGLLACSIPPYFEEQSKIYVPNIRLGKAYKKYIYCILTNLNLPIMFVTTWNFVTRQHMARKIVARQHVTIDCLNIRPGKANNKFLSNFTLPTLFVTTWNFVTRQHVARNYVAREHMTRSQVKKNLFYFGCTSLSCKHILFALLMRAIANQI